MSEKIIAGNWKMNKTQSQTKQFISELIPMVKDTINEVVICVPFTDLSLAIELAKGSNIRIGAQNMHFEEKGAYTGEISAQMLYEMGVEYVIIGHSERREYFAETDESVNLKLKSAIANDLVPILCIGETFDEREKGSHFDVIEKQIKLDFEGIHRVDAGKVIIAYEPIWAIGTGLTPSLKDVEEITWHILNVLDELYGYDVAIHSLVLYGGSVKSSNSQELFIVDNIDGGLIGGASLDVKEFAEICNKNYVFNMKEHMDKHIIC